MNDGPLKTSKTPTLFNLPPNVSDLLVNNECCKDFKQLNIIMNAQKNITLKYLVVGDSGVGKTSLLVRYCEDSFQADYLSTIGVDFKIKRIELNQNQITLNIWDTAGQERFRNITKSFYKGAHGIILTYSITDPASFNHIESWIDQIKEVGNADTDMILVGSKADLESDRKVARKQAQTLSEKYNLQFVQTSAKDDCNINRIFELLTAQVVQRIKVDERAKENNTTTLTGKKEQSKKEQCC